MTPEEEKAFNERLKPKVEPTSQLVGPLYDDLEHALELIDCAYYAIHHPSLIPDEIGDPIRRALDDGISKARSVKNALHDMVAWVR